MSVYTVSYAGGGGTILTTRDLDSARACVLEYLEAPGGVELHRDGEALDYTVEWSDDGQDSWVEVAS